MRFSGLFLYALCVIAQAVHDARAPIEHLSLSASSDDFAELTPLVSNPLRSNSARGDMDRRDNPLEGLLVRQSCPSGWGLCNDGRCCPLGGRCCGGGKTLRFLILNFCFDQNQAVAAMWETFATPVAAVRIAKRDVKGIHAALRTTVVVQVGFTPLY